MIDLDAALDTAALPERTVQVCLSGPLNEAVETARSAGDTDALQAAQRAVWDASHPFRLRGLSRPAWTSLQTAHPPRDGHDMDARVGFDYDSFPAALVRASLVDPDVTDDDRWARLDDALTSGQFDELYATAMQLAKVKVDVVPFSPDSTRTPASGPKPKRPAG